MHLQHIMNTNILVNISRIDIIVFNSDILLHIVHRQTRLVETSVDMPPGLMINISLYQS